MRQAVRTGLAIPARSINARSRFDRKNYFYGDLPQGYQISQLYHPIVGAARAGGWWPFASRRPSASNAFGLEQDAGKSVEDLSPTQSCVDLNGSGYDP